ncbi:MAG: MBL fold metallo-hydrolase [Planctomycetes bacterium]|nr:MBL fold metallo-hydrolase [Planctomycetota bacterium]
MVLNVAFLDVLHGDSIVATFDDNGKKACIVVDGGETKAAAKRLAAYLKHERVETIDLLIATHIDADHVNGLVNLLKHESSRSNSWNKGRQKCIRYYWGPRADPNWTPETKVARPVRGKGIKSNRETMTFITQSVGQNQTLNDLVEQHIVDTDNMYYPSLQDKPPLRLFKKVKIELLAPDLQILDSEIKKKAMSVVNMSALGGMAGNSNANRGLLKLQDLVHMVDLNAEHMAEIAKRTANNQSIVIKLTPKSTRSKKWSFLLTGDAEHESCEMMMRTASVKRKLRSRVLKVPHHGSVNGINKSTFKKIQPHYSIVCVGQKHGLPDGETLNLVKSKKNSKLFCTERNNYAKKPGPCLKKRRCVRKTKSAFRSLRFEINLGTGSERIRVFKFYSGDRRIRFVNEKPWCPEKRWQ